MNPISKRLAEIQDYLAPTNVARVGTAYLRSITPIRSGFARRNTIQTGADIHADYEYAGALDQNHSPQTKGQGLIEPTMRHLEDYVNKGT
jgi:hypothetical protein